VTLPLERHIFRSPKLQSVVYDAIAFFVETPDYPLPLTSLFFGAGVYALYYLGNYEPYRPIAERNRQSLTQPIYVGKAVPPGWRTARSRLSETSDLYRRLQEHARSVTQAQNLHPSDFRCRFMILSDIEADLIVPVEAELIRRFLPLWNCVVDGFGNHDPGSGRYNQAQSEWDAIHPGRPWAKRLAGQSPNPDAVLGKVRTFLASHSFLNSTTAS